MKCGFRQHRFTRKQGFSDRSGDFDSPLVVQVVSVAESDD